MENQTTDTNKQNASDENASSVVSKDSPSADQWKTKVDSACKQWNKLQQSELVETGGDNQRISELVQKRYSINKIEADKQVKEFFSKH